jgi:hypothetical protein
MRSPDRTNRISDEYAAEVRAFRGRKKNSKNAPSQLLMGIVRPLLSGTTKLAHRPDHPERGIAIGTPLSLRTNLPLNATKCAEMRVERYEGAITIRVAGSNRLGPSKKLKKQNSHRI